MLLKIDPSGSLTVEDTPSLNEEQVAAYKEAAASSISLGYTVAFPYRCSCDRSNGNTASKGISY